MSEQFTFYVSAEGNVHLMSAPEQLTQTNAAETVVESSAQHEAREAKISDPEFIIPIGIVIGLSVIAFKANNSCKREIIGRNHFSKSNT